jgi:predicted nucleic acid-binding protein
VPAVAISDSPCRDRDDAHVLGLLRSSEAGCAVTGDKDLLVLGAFEGRPIMSPRELFDLLAARP